MDTDKKFARIQKYSKTHLTPFPAPVRGFELDGGDPHSLTPSQGIQNEMGLRSFPATLSNPGLEAVVIPILKR
jgi:hypothetical protein